MSDPASGGTSAGRRFGVGRKGVGIAIVALWIAGLGALGLRLVGRSESDRIADVAARVEPAAYYYEVIQNDTPVGVVSSVIDTARGRLRMTERFDGRLVIYGDSQRVEAAAVAYLSPRFALDSFVLSVGGEQSPSQVRGVPKRGTTRVLLPTQAPIAFMLSGEHAVGREQQLWIYNPVAGDVQRGTLRIVAESLFTVVDSAAYDSTARRWVPAHTDTVRAWSIAPSATGLTVWVDAQGRIVSAAEPGGMHVQRTAYEIAFENWQRRDPSRGRRTR